jgi:hypothetical protein
MCPSSDDSYGAAVVSRERTLMFIHAPLAAEVHHRGPTAPGSAAA